MWNHLIGYNGLLLPLLEFIVQNELPTPQAIADAQAWLLNEIDLSVGPYPLRHNADLRNKLNISDKPNKPRFFSKANYPNIPFDLIPTDNEAATSFFVEVKNGKVFSNMTIHQALQNEIKVGICRQSHPATERQLFQQFSIATTMTNHPLKISNRGLLLCHIADAADNINTHQLFNLELKERIFRMLSPLNVFPFPFQHTGKRFKYEHLKNGIDVMQDLGGTPEFQDLFEAILFNYMVNANLNHAHEVWYEKSGRGVHLGINYLNRTLMYPQIIMQHAQTRVDIVPINLTNQTNIALNPHAPPVVNNPGPVVIIPNLGNNIRAYAGTRFKVDENMYQQLINNHDPMLLINVSGGTGATIHPTGTYNIPRDIAIAFIQSKRGTPNWNTHHNFHSAKIPADLRNYFIPRT